MKKLALLLFFATNLSACGGGTSGTGTGERSFEGHVTFTSGAPVANAEVTIAETGQNTITDADGTFSILSDFSGTTVDLAIVSGTVSTSVSVNTSANASAAVSIDVTIDPNHPQTAPQISSIEVHAQIVGFCDPDFENFRTIRQSNDIADNTTCAVRVQMYGDGKLLERIPFSVQRSGCNELKFTTVQTAETGFGVDAGVGTADFTYFNDSDHCVFRVVAPDGVKGIDPVIYEIDTFLKQKIDSTHK